jgi:hypothetical protein
VPFADWTTNVWNALRGKAASASSGPPGGGYGSSYGYGPSFSDAFKLRRGPSPAELVEAYKSLVYACVNLNANGVARVPLRLFAVTKSGQPKPKCLTEGVGRAAKARLKSLPYLAKTMAGAEEVEEVTEHPLLDLIHRVNDDLDYTQLLVYTVMGLDIVGSAYWWPDGSRGVPKEVWALPPHLVQPEFTAGGLVPDGYRFGAHRFAKGDLIRFRRLSARNPYGAGYGPEQASIEYSRLEDAFVSVQDEMLSNGPMPKVVVSHKDPKGAFGQAERKRLEDDMNRRGRGGRAGGAFVVDGAVSIAPMGYSPTDLGGLEISNYDLERIANCFDVPVSMLKTEDVNRANAEAGLEQHARNAIEPRCKLIASALTRWTHSLGAGLGKAAGRASGYDRLLWAFDSAVPQEKQAEADLHTKYVAMGLPPNVALTEAGYDAVEGGDVPLIASGLQRLEDVASGKLAEQAAAGADQGFDEEGDPEADDEGEQDDDPEATDDEADDSDPASKSLADARTKDCGSGAGGFKPGNTCGRRGTSNSPEGAKRRQGAAGRRKPRGPKSGVGPRTRAAQRRRRGHRRAERKRHEARHANPAHRELQADHHGQRRDLAREIKDERKDHRRSAPKDRKQLAREIKKERKDTHKAQAKERESTKKRHETEKGKLEKAHGKQREALGAKHAAEKADPKLARHGERLTARQDKQRARLERQHKREAREQRREHKTERRDLRQEHREGRQADRANHREQVQTHRDDERTARNEQHMDHRERITDLHNQHRQERADLLRSRRNEARATRDERRRERAGGSKALAPAPLTKCPDDPACPCRDHRPGISEVPSAATILKVALEDLGHEDGDHLTDDERREVLKAIKSAGRAWLRAEAEAVGDDGGEDATKALGGALRERAGRFFDRARGYLRELLTAGVLAVAGPGPISQAMEESIERSHAVQVEYLDNFKREILDEAKPVDSASFPARAEMYGNSPYAAAIEAQRADHAATGVKTQERRRLGHAQHCDDCPPLADLDWQPIGSLPALGFTWDGEPSECRQNCECWFEYR